MKDSFRVTGKCDTCSASATSLIYTATERTRRCHVCADRWWAAWYARRDAEAAA